MEENNFSAPKPAIWGKCKAILSKIHQFFLSGKSAVGSYSLLLLAFFAIELLAFIMLLPRVSYCLLFGFFWSGLLSALILLIPRKVSRVVFGIFYFLFLIWTLSQLGYYQVFDKLMWLSALAYTGEGMMFIWDVLSKFPLLWWIAAIALVTLGIYIIIKYPPTPKGLYKRIPLIAVCAVCIIAIALIPQIIFMQDDTSHEDLESYTNVATYESTYYKLYDVKKVYDLCGIYHLTFRDIWNFRLYKLTAEYEQDTLQQREELNDYFAQRPDHTSNDMTGIFKGKNVVYVLMESMDDWLITQKDTPTIRKLMDEGISFTNFFTPGYGSARTLNTEYCMNSGLYLPTNGEFVFDYMENSFDQSIAAQFARNGYTGYVFHYNSAEYYNRGKMEPLLGYNAYISYENYTSEESDLLNDCYLFEDSRISDIFFRQGQSFNTIITRSAHLGYTYDELLSEYAFSLYPDAMGTYPTEEEDCARLKAKLVDDMFARLLKELEEKGVLENTVIVGVTDHYTYGCQDIDALYENSNVDSDHKILLERTPCFIWSANGPQMQVDKVLQTADLVPTLLNLFGIESPYEYIGQDAFHPQYAGYALFPNGSWISDGVVCMVETDGSYDILVNEKSKELTQDYIDNMCSIALSFIHANNLIITSNYYGPAE